MILNYYWYGKKKDTFVKGDATLVLKFRLRVGPMIVLVFYFWTFAKPIHLSNYERERERERETFELGVILINWLRCFLSPVINHSSL